MPLNNHFARSNNLEAVLVQVSDMQAEKALEDS